MPTSPREWGSAAVPAGAVELEALLQRVDHAIDRRARRADAGESLHEFGAEAMARPPRGRPRPIGRVGIVTLYHYSPAIIRSVIRPRSYWTDFSSRSAQDVARITGRDPAMLRYRYEVRMTLAERDQYFVNRATKIVPGLPAADEYINTIAIPIAWVQRVTPMRPF